MEVGFLGLGIMGKAISMNLLQHGFKVTVWNRSLSKVFYFEKLSVFLCQLLTLFRSCKEFVACFSDIGNWGYGFIAYGKLKGFFIFPLYFCLTFGVLCSVMNLWHMELRWEKVRLK